MKTDSYFDLDRMLIMHNVHFLLVLSTFVKILIDASNTRSVIAESRTIALFSNRVCLFMCLMCIFTMPALGLFVDTDFREGRNNFIAYHSLGEIRIVQYQTDQKKYRAYLIIAVLNTELI